MNKKGGSHIYPEYESIKELSNINNIPLKDLYKLEELR